MTGGSLLVQAVSAASERARIADRAGMHWTYISAVERGLRNLSFDSITRLAQGLQVSWATLFSTLTRRFRLPAKAAGRTRVPRPRR